MIEQFEKYIHDEDALWLLRKIIDRSKVDVSYMNDEEYANCMDSVFNSLEHSQIDRSLLTGEKFMAKHLNIGDQVAQVAGIVYPVPIDNYIKIVRGVKFYGRYMDDSYVIHESKEYLQDLLKDIIQIADSIGITVNIRKTRICKLSEYWRFLQVQYALTDTGRIIQKINPKRLTCMRRKMKKLAYILIFGIYLILLRRKEVEQMAVIYVALIVKGKRTYDSVPDLIKPQVKELLIDLELEHLITEE